MNFEATKDGYCVSTDPARLDLRMIHGFLSRSYWAEGVAFDVLRKSVQNALCFGLYLGEKQVGFARVISDFARFAYLADVFILPEYRGRGLSRWMMECIMQHPELQNIARWLLVTKDAHGLYRQYGFRNPEDPGLFMEIVNSPDGGD